MSDPRYPYTYAADFIRELAGMNDNGETKLSRADASKIREGISGALNMDDAALAELLANHFNQNRG